jgi:multiple sugar transport system permease protein
MAEQSRKVAGERWRPLAIGLGVCAVLFWTLFPFYWTFKASFMREIDVLSYLVGWPERGFTLDNYRLLFGLSKGDSIFGGQTRAVMSGFVNSALVALPSAAIAAAVAAFAGYAFGRFEFPGKKALLFTLLVSRVLPPISMVIPYFVFFSAVGMVGSLFGLGLTYLTAAVPLLSWMLMGYFAALPIEVERAARIDGCSRLQVLFYVTFPMAAPGIAAAFIIAFLVAWNDLLFGIVLTGGTASQTLSPSLLGLSPLMPGFRTELVLFAAASILSTVPPLLLALVFQRFITGLNLSDPVTVGSD